LIKVLIPYALRAFTERNAEVEVKGSTAGDAVNALANAYPALKNHLFTEDGQLRDFINLFVGGANINSLQGLNTPVADNGEVMIVPAIAGGCAASTAGGAIVGGAVAGGCAGRRFI